MDRFIALSNIARFEQMLSREIDPDERQIVETLLFEERTRLRAIEAQPLAPPHRSAAPAPGVSC